MIRPDGMSLAVSGQVWALMERIAEDRAAEIEATGPLEYVHAWCAKGGSVAELMADVRREADAALEQRCGQKFTGVR